MYLNWQGTYFSMFLQAFLSPVNNYGMPQLRIVMVLNTLIFFASLVGFTWISLSRFIKNECLLKLIICTCIVFTMTAYNTFEEVFYWFSGATSYSFPVSCLFYSLIAIVFYSGNTFTHSKIRKYFLSMMAIALGLCAMGGSLTVAAAGCCLMFLVCIYSFLTYKKIKIPYLLFFLSYLSGAVINTISPGNFIRQATSEGEGIQIIDSLKNTYIVYESNLRWIFNRTNFSLILLIILICGMFLYQKVNVNMKNYTIVSLCAVFVPCIVIFPVVLGYNLPWIPNRCVFIVLLSMTFVYCNLALVAGYWIIEIVSEKNRVIIAVMAAMLIFVTESVNTYYISDCSTGKVFVALLNGTIPDYYAQYIDMIHHFEESQGTDLIVEQSEIPEAIEDFYCFDLSDDIDNRTNRAIANIYHLNSIVKRCG